MIGVGNMNKRSRYLIDRNKCSAFQYIDLASNHINICILTCLRKNSAKTFAIPPTSENLLLKIGRMVNEMIKLIIICIQFEN